MFCGFYLRCGRMAVLDESACRDVFLEACNARYEPIYRALAENGRLALSTQGFAACAEHLTAVPCEQQIQDLDGPCRAMWRGAVAVGGACGIGIENFVCAPDTTCVVTPDFCGTCEPAAAVDARCGDGVRCPDYARCIDEICVARARPGEPCGDAGCVLGAACDNGTCRGPTRASVGEACDRGRQCPYKSACVNGACVEAALIGEPCGGAVTCASGTCEAAICTRLFRPGEACERGDQCIGGRCTGVCPPLESDCLDD